MEEERLHVHVLGTVKSKCFYFYWTLFDSLLLVFISVS